MAFDSFADFIAMGKHGPYVWFCYGLTLLVVCGLIWHVRAERLRFFREQIQQIRRDQSRLGGSSSDGNDDAS